MSYVINQPFVLRNLKICFNFSSVRYFLIDRLWVNGNND